MQLLYCTAESLLYGTCMCSNFQSNVGY